MEPDFRLPEIRPDHHQKSVRFLAHRDAIARMITQLLPLLLFSIASMVAYLRWHGLPRPKSRARASQLVARGQPTTG